MTRALRWSLVALAAACPVFAQQPAVPRRPVDSTARSRLEVELRRAFARAVRQRVGLNEEQMRALAPIAQRYELRRRQLQQREREARTSLRDLMRDTAADSRRIDELLNVLIGFQKERVTILEAEQRDLATIMSPPQRARYLALQEQMRRRVEEMRRRRAAQAAGEGAPPPL